MEPQESRPATSGPVRSTEFAALLEPLIDEGPHLAVAVSGGPDSLALTLLSAEWAACAGRQVTALTVDHGLRPESPAEAEMVGAWLATRGISHVTLRWEGPKPATGIQAAAREARYGLLTGWCRAHGAISLLLAHHADDQNETVVLRLQRGSGPRGLAGISSLSERNGIRLVRPLLGLPKERLRETLRVAGQSWIEDPSNDNARYRRTAARYALMRLAAVAPGSASRFAVLARLRGAARQANEHAALALLARAATVSPLQNASIDLSELRRGKASAVETALTLLLQAVGGLPYPPGTEALHRLLRWLASAQGGARTLHRCVVHKGGIEATLWREHRNLPAIAIAPGERAAWDGRFLIERAGGDDPGVIAAAGPAGWAACRDQVTIPCRREVAFTLPALFVGGVLVAAPQLGLSTARNPLTVRPLPRQTLAFRPFAVVSGAG